MKTQANTLFAFRGMTDNISVEIVNIPATNNNPVAVTMFLFSSQSSNNTIRILVNKNIEDNGMMHVMYEATIGNENYSHSSNKVPSQELNGLLLAIVNDVFSI